MENNREEAQRYYSQGIDEFNAGNIYGAMSDFDKATDLDPSMEEAWYALGTVFVRQKDYSGALMMYQTAYRLDQTYADAIYGMALAYAMLRQYESASLQCNKYIELFGEDDKILKLQEGIRQCGYVENNSSEDICNIKDLVDNVGSTQVISALQIMPSLIAAAHQHGILTTNASPAIKDVWDQADAMTDGIYDEFYDAYSDDDVVPADVVGGMMNYSMYSGIGAVLLWKKDKNRFHKEELFDLLTENRGFNDLDEYVKYLLGYRMFSEQGDQLHMLVVSTWPVVLRAGKYQMPDEYPENTSQLHECMKAIYLFGAVWELQALGYC